MAAGLPLGLGATAMAERVLRGVLPGLETGGMMYVWPAGVVVF